jgi:hypothetical protein
MNDNGVVCELKTVNGEQRTRYVSFKIQNRACNKRKHPSYLHRSRYSSPVNCPISVGMVPVSWFMTVAIRITKNG